MRTIATNIYEFKELSEAAKKKAVEKISTINVDFNWWDLTYKDAKNIGLKITFFDLDRNRHAKGEFITNAVNCAERIIEEHGENCDTYKTAKEFLSALNEYTGQFPDIEDSDEDEIENLESEFLKSLLEDYSIMLQKESEYLQTDEAIIEAIEANGYEFTEDGKLV